jgi:phosphatidylglycerophosphate synthase
MEVFLATAVRIRRLNRSFLADAEQSAIRWLLPRISRSIEPIHLTAIGVFGSILAGAGLVGCNWSFFWLTLVIVGVALNWFGDSLDGSLARYRQTERPRFGFLVDHTCDLFSQVIMIVCFGLSPFLSLVAAFIVLLCYLLFSAYTYIRAAVQNIHQMAYIGVGATEFRILMIAWALIGAALGLHESLVNSPDKLDGLDLTIAFLAGIAVVGLGAKAIIDAYQIAIEEEDQLRASGSRVRASTSERPLSGANDQKSTG